MADNGTLTRGARVNYLPPPLYYAAGIAGGVLINWLAPLPIGARPAASIAGIVVGVAGLILTFAGVAGVIKHRTTIVPHHPVAALITTGAYRWSRNPMYAGLAIAYLGAALVIGSWWPVLLWPVVVFAVARMVIRPEEQYLARRFGDTYADYQVRVRRWL
jgi:protein-S-isoprenylcysteine O-methyltransferase Ste14